MSIKPVPSRKLMSFLAALLLALPTLALAQAPTLQPGQYQYGLLHVSYKNKGSAITLNVGSRDQTDPAQAAEVTQAATYRMEIDAVNYLSSRGWEVYNAEFIGSYSIALGCRYYLRRRLPVP